MFSLIRSLLTKKKAGPHETFKVFSARGPNVAPLPETFRVVTWNCLKMKEDGAYDELESLMKDAHIGCFQENWGDTMPTFLVSNLEGYATFCKAYTFKDEWTGTMTYTLTESGFPIGLVESVEPLGFIKRSFLLKCAHQSGAEIGIFNVHLNYFGSTKKWVGELEKLLAECGDTYPLIVTGDFNTKNSERQKILRDAMKEAEFKYAYHPGARELDHMFFKGLELKAALSVPSKTSNHHPLITEFTLPLQIQGASK